MNYEEAFKEVEEFFEKVESESLIPIRDYIKSLSEKVKEDEQKSIDEQKYIDEQSKSQKDSDPFETIAKKYE